MDLTRRGFLKLLAGAAAAAVVPAMRPEVVDLAPALPEIQITADTSQAVSALTRAAGLIRSLSVQYEAEVIDVTTIHDRAAFAPLSRLCRLELEMYWDPESMPQLGETLGADWFEANGIRDHVGAMVCEAWPEDLRFLVTAQSVQIHAPEEPAIATFQMVEVQSPGERPALS